MILTGSNRLILEAAEMKFVRNHKLNNHKYNISIRTELNVRLGNETEYPKLYRYRNFLRKKNKFRT
jgi:hypothetical protein